MLKETALSMTPAVTKLFNMSINLGVLRDEWKIARVSPVPKSSTRSDSTNYRPISLLSVLSKLLEEHMRDILLDHLTQFSPISAQQWGFCRSKSATCVLLALQTFGINGWIPVLIYVQYSLTQYHTDLS